MKISDLVAELDALANVLGRTVDTVKTGDPDAELQRVAVTI